MVRIDTDTTSKPGVVRLCVHGQLDIEAASAFAEAMICIKRLRWPAEISLGEIDFIDGSGLSLLMDAHSRALRAGHPLTIVDASRCVRRLIEITDTAGCVPPYFAHEDSPWGNVEDEITGRAREPVGTQAFRA
jgi:anti-anti-sigma factor